MKKAVPYVNDEVCNRDFKYYIFDWDDNILHMPTKIIMEHRREDGTWEKQELSTATFALVRADTANYRPPLEGGWGAAFRHFADAEDGKDAGKCFIEDTIAALAKVAGGEKPSPSFNTFKKTLVEGRLFAIVTARGHAPETIERAVRIFIDQVLSPHEREVMMSNLRGYRRWLDKVEAFGSDEEELDYYLGMCRYSAVTHSAFSTRMESDPIYSEKLATAPQAARSELAKEFAIRDFVEHVMHTLQRTNGLGRSIAIGFSDDDKRNVKSVRDYIDRELSKRFTGVTFVIYDTSDRTLKKGRKVWVRGQDSLPGL